MNGTCNEQLNPIDVIDNNIDAVISISSCAN